MRLIDADAFIKENQEIIDCEIDHPKYQDTLRELISQAPTVERPHGEWIPLKWEDEETKCKILDYPYDGKWVIVTDGINISVERIKIDAIDHFYPAGRWFELKDVVAWMPLPEPYQKEGEE